VAKMHTVPYFHRLFPAKEPYQQWPLLQKETCNLYRIRYYRVAKMYRMHYVTRSLSSKRRNSPTFAFPPKGELCIRYYGLATISSLLQFIGLFCKRALLKRRYSAKETRNF